MCLLLTSPNGFPELTDKLLESSLRRNSHGAGLMWHENGELRFRRQRYVGLRTLRGWLESLPANTFAALHLRQATAGPRNLANVHPYVMEANSRVLGVMHNGNLEAWAGCTRRSDTARFAEEWLDTVWRAEPDIGSLRFAMQLRAAVPAGNRLVMADNEGRWRIIGQDEGWWLGDMWLSNRKAQHWD